MHKNPDANLQKTLRPTSASRNQLFTSISDPSLRPFKRSPTPLTESNAIHDCPTFAPKSFGFKNTALPPSKSKQAFHSNSPTTTENLQKSTKLSKETFLEIYQIKPNPGLKKRVPRHKNFSGDVGTNPTSGLIDELITIEKQEGSDLSNEKIKKYLDFLETIGEYFPGSSLVLGKMKEFFTKLFYEKLKLNNEVNELKTQPSPRLVESMEIDQNLSTFEQLESSFSNKIIDENKSLIEKIAALQKDLNTLKAKEKQYQKFILFLKSKGNNFDAIFKEYFASKNSKVKKVPKLPLRSSDASTADQSVGFHEEFMSKIDEFSNSWRNLIKDQKKY